MRLSERYRALDRRIAGLRKSMLPSRFDPLGQYPDKVRDRVMGFRVLAHAEIEAYIEERSQAAVRLAATYWKHKRKSSKVLIALASFVHAKTPSPPIEFLKDDNLKKRIDVAVTTFEQRIRDNHGIRFRHIVPLLSMVGIEEDEVDQIWLANLDSFGRSRGDTAHQSAHNRAVSAIDPHTEWVSVRGLVLGARAFDRLISMREKGL